MLSTGESELLSKRAPHVQPRADIKAAQQLRKRTQKACIETSSFPACVIGIQRPVFDVRGGAEGTDQMNQQHEEIVPAAAGKVQCIGQWRNSMAETPNTDWTKTIAWQTNASTAHMADCQKMALQQQNELLQDAQQRVTAWTKRRQEALETGLDALHRMSACKSPVEAAAICSDWMAGSITRVLADMTDAQAHTLKMAEQFQKTSRAMLESPPAPVPGIAEATAIAKAMVSPVPTSPEHLREAAD
jgi:hypothetical protein